MKVKDLQNFAGLQDDDEVLVVRADGVGPILVPYSAIKKGPVAAVSEDIPAQVNDDPDIEALIQELVLTAHPVGSYYWSEKSTDPGTLFGGTWTRIYDRFLYGRDADMSVGTTGGASTVALTTSTMPAHVHNDSISSVSVGSHTHTYGWSSHRHRIGSHTHSGSHTHTTTHAHYVNPHTHTSSNWFGTGAEQQGYQAYYGGTRPGSPLVSQESTTSFGYSGIGSGFFSTGISSVTNSSSTSGTTGSASLSSSSITLGAPSSFTISNYWLANTSNRNTSTSASFSVGSVGSGTAHENMPPYINAYCWRRVS